MKLLIKPVTVILLLVGVTFLGGVLWYQQNRTVEGEFAPDTKHLNQMRAIDATDVCYTEFPERYASEPIFLARGKGIKLGDHMKILRPEARQGDFELVEVKMGGFGGSALGRGPNGEVGISFFDVVVEGRPDLMLWTDGEAGGFGWSCVSRFELADRMRREEGS